MSARDFYEGVLIELRKENAPNILLEDFNYFINKAINQYVNKRYNIYDVNQQTTDDLRVLKATTILPVTQRVDAYDSISTLNNRNATYCVDLPDDYLHILNCICVYELQKRYKCYNAGEPWRAAATKLTADAFSQVLDNYWMKPTYKRPYYYIHNLNTSIDVPTNKYNPETKTGTDAPLNIEHRNRTVYDIHLNNIQSGDINSDENVTMSDASLVQSNYLYGTDIDRTVTVEPDQITKRIVSDTDSDIIIPQDWTGIESSPNNVSLREKSAGYRYGNTSKVRLEIRYGSDNSVFKLTHVYIDYIKTPQHIRLTQKQIDQTEDFSQILEFPDYVCQEILNELVHIIMENIADPRLQTHPVVSQSIAAPAQAQAPEAAGQSA